MKKLLILAYDFPPYVSVGGLRPYNWYKYLKEFGVEPISGIMNWISHLQTKPTIIKEGDKTAIPFCPKLFYYARIVLKFIY